MNAELQLLTEINNFAQSTPWLHLPMLLLSSYAMVVYVVLWVAAFWIARRRASPSTMAAVIWAPIGVLLAELVSQPLGQAIGEKRPCRTEPDIVAIGKCSKGSSLPSDHAVVAGAVVVGLLLVSHRLLAWVGVVAALLIAFSRLYLGVHWPHDTLAGLVLGVAVSLAGWLVVRVVLTRLAAGLHRTPLRPLLASTSARTSTATPAAQVSG
ncbi:MAG TPA: phosphatase PAP2 family protein [Pseudonocardia sp.]|uniref:phosphatase PAP2 family protein n=1 Tax=Pseudonocardia sp. TaxID=60912 RepID=UPI002BFCA0AF|nr:phosphatase PAP2 family protein [Pseudonocardia sp.]HTF46640.1 phosphatase PAP2 family protein [Pseudonocardia sp.]